jgi:hypothetical protein
VRWLLAVLKGELMEIAALVIAILAFISASALWFIKVDYSDIVKLEDEIKRLKLLNRRVYKSLVEEYRDLTKTNMCPDGYYDGVEFYAPGMDKEFIRYEDLEDKIADVKALKARLCDNTCDKRPEYTLDGSDNISIQVGGTISSTYGELLKNYEEPKKKKLGRKK